MTEIERGLLRVASDLLEYPDQSFREKIRSVEEQLASCGHPQSALMLRAVENLSRKDLKDLREEYVAIFDHNPETSLYMAWHRYGNDRGQGRAMAALNGLYRSAGFEPVAGIMPDYLPVMLEFVSVADDWAIDVILDGFGAELDELIRQLQEINSDYALILEAALGPLRNAKPDFFKPRTGPDATIRPMARPEQEFVPPELHMRFYDRHSRN